MLYPGPALIRRTAFAPTFVLKVSYRRRHPFRYADLECSGRMVHIVFGKAVLHWQAVPALWHRMFLATERSDCDTPFYRNPLHALPSIIPPSETSFFVPECRPRLIVPGMHGMLVESVHHNGRDCEAPAPPNTRCHAASKQRGRADNAARRTSVILDTCPTGSTHEL